MNTQETLNYSRIEAAIQYIRQHFKEQPGLNELAEKINLSPFHFQRLFTDWAGVSPKKFIQYLSVDHAKSMLRSQATLLDAAYETGLSGTGRLHDLFVSLEGMTPGEFKNGGEALTINYSFDESIFGTYLAASTAKGLCHLAFISDKTQALQELKSRFPNARFSEAQDAYQQSAAGIFSEGTPNPEKIKVHLKGTGFQLKVWEALLKIPMGALSSYGSIAQSIGHPNASRAVGSAVGDNPIAYIIPCHRVIQANGTYGQYRWGSTRKSMLIGWEAAKTGLPETA